MRTLPHEEPTRTICIDLDRLEKKHCNRGDYNDRMRAGAREALMKAVARFAAIMIEVSVDYFDPPGEKRDLFVAALDRELVAGQGR